MSLPSLYSTAARSAAVGLLALLAAAVLAARLGDALPGGTAERAAVAAGWGLAAAAGTVLAAASAPLRAQAILWVLALIGAAVSYGGLVGPSLARSLDLLAAVVAFAVAVFVTVVQADVAVAKPRDRF